MMAAARLCLADMLSILGGACCPDICDVRLNRRCYCWEDCFTAPLSVPACVSAAQVVSVIHVFLYQRPFMLLQIAYIIH